MKIKKKVDHALNVRTVAYELAVKTATRPSHFNKPGSRKPRR